jgi:hypothetical protein
MNKIKFKILPTVILLAVSLATSCQQNIPTPDFPATETALWQAAWDVIPATQTQFAILTAQSRVPTETPWFPILPVTTATPTRVLIPPAPTATLMPVIPATPLPLQNVTLSGKILLSGIDAGERVLDLSDYHFKSPFQTQMSIYQGQLYTGSWSPDGKYLALTMHLRPLSQDIRYTDLVVCILRNQDVENENFWENLDEKAKCIRVYTNIFNPRSITQGDYAEIKTISWSSNNNYLLLTVKGLNNNITSPCLIEIDTSSVDCRWANIFISPGELTLGMLNRDVYKVVTGAHAISWSPLDENKFAMPLKTNWLFLSEGVKNGRNTFINFPWYGPTDNLKQGLYLINIKPVMQYEHPPAYHAHPPRTPLAKTGPALNPEQSLPAGRAALHPGPRARIRHARSSRSCSAWACCCWPCATGGLIALGNCPGASWRVISLSKPPACCWFSPWPGSRAGLWRDLFRMVTVGCWGCCPRCWSARRRDWLSTRRWGGGSGEG